MIFRIDGEVGYILALTPIIREWRRRNEHKSVYVETYTPELFEGNSDISFAAPSVNITGEFYDMNCIRWRELGRPVVEIFAEHIIGDKNLASWKPVMAHMPDAILRAGIYRGKTSTGKPLAVCAFKGNISKENAINIVGMIKDRGFDVDELDDVTDWHDIRARIQQAVLFVGEDGDYAAIAFTTDTPAIVCYVNRIPDYFPPYRGDVPFEPITSRERCQEFKLCHQQSKMEFAKVYQTVCRKQDFECCKRYNLAPEVYKAMDRIGVIAL